MLGTISYAIPTGVVEIEIIDNAFTRRWWPHYKKIEPYLRNSLQVCHRNCVDAHVFEQMKQGYHPERRAELVESIWKLKNCVKVLNKDGLRNKKEFVNHKILDLAGDFMLSGFRVLGKVRCYQGGHELTNIFLRKLIKQKLNYSIIEAENKIISKSISQFDPIKIAANG